MTITAAEFQAITRHDFYTFINRSFLELNPQVSFLHNWHIELIAGELERCRRGETRRLIINVPPRSLKSHCATVAFPAFLLGHNPSAQIICASYGQDLANKHAMDCRNLMASPWYQAFVSHSPVLHAASGFAGASLTTQKRLPLGHFGRRRAHRARRRFHHHRRSPKAGRGAV